MLIEVKPIDVVAKLKMIADIKEDRELEKLLGLTKGSIYSYVSRDSIPYKAIAFFCLERDIEINYILGKPVKKVQ